MWRLLLGMMALLNALVSPISPLLAGVDEAHIKPADKKSWGELLVDFVGYRGFGKSYALVVGISDFDHFSSLPTANDPLRMRDFLIKEAGFDYVHVLTDEKATKTRIEELMVDDLPGRINKNTSSSSTGPATALNAPTTLAVRLATCPSQAHLSAAMRR